VPENKELTQEEIAALLKKRAEEKQKPICALIDDELDATSGGYGRYGYVISDSNGERVNGYCAHPESADASLKNCLQSGTSCAYGWPQARRRVGAALI